MTPTPPNPPGLSADHLRLIEQVCHRFEQACKAAGPHGPLPDLNDYLADAAPAARPALLRELTLLEGIYRQMVHERSLESFPIRTPSPLPRPMEIPDAIPARAGRYRLEKEIARGAMGRIVRVRDEDFDRPLAMKILLDRDADLEDRFLREARMTGVLQHPGIPPVHALGRLDDGRPYFVMKLIQGRSLQELLQARREQEGGGFSQHATDFPALMAIFKSLCDTVGYAHSRRVIHRDLKPANIMVGAFGEVQVMDWGLAKIVDEKRPDTVLDAGRGTVFSLKRAAVRADETVTGSVMGTPSYMAPEQAAGDVARVDARTDVFGLGAILCELLTGRPPYHGGSTIELVEKATHADLGEALAALDACGHDAELIELTKRCLSSNKEDRPADGSVVAAAIAAYQAALEQRVTQAEIDRAAEHARADEEHRRREAEHAKLEAERKRRRLTVGVAVGLVLVLLAGGAAAFWFQADRVRRKTVLNTEVGAALEQATRAEGDLREQLANPMHADQLISDIHQWKSMLDRARAPWERARAASEGNRELLTPAMTAAFDDLEQRLVEDDRDWSIARKLDAVRLRSLTSMIDAGNSERLMQQVPIFAELGVDLLDEEPEQAARKIVASRLRSVLLAAIDHWAAMSQYRSFARAAEPAERKTRERLLAIARGAEFDVWRDAFFRKPSVLDNPKELMREMDAAHPKDMPSRAIIAAAIACLQEHYDAGDSFLRRAAADPHHDRDFWLHLLHSAINSRPTERIINAKMALAIRPQCAEAAAYLGMAYLNNNDLDAAVLLFQRAIQLNEDLPLAHAFLGAALRSRNDPSKNDLAEAAKQWRETLELDPDNPLATQQIGQALLEDDKVDDAIAEFTRALKRYPSSPALHESLGIALFKKGEFDAALAQFQQAIDSAPTFLPQTKLWLGMALQAKGDWNSALNTYDEVTRRAPSFGPAYLAHGRALLESGNDPKNLDAAIKALEKAVRYLPGPANARQRADAYQGIGIALSRDDDWAGAEEQFRLAIELDPDSPQARWLLGDALLRNNFPAQALGPFRKAVQLAPKSAPAHASLGEGYFACGDYQEALAHLSAAAKIDTKSVSKERLDEAVRRERDRKEELARRKKEADAHPTDVDKLLAYGLALRNAHDLPGAIAQLRRALKTDPKNLPACDALADALYDMGNFDEAVAEYRHGIDLDPRPGRMQALANLLREVDDRSGALALYKKSAEVDPANPRRWLALGRAHQDSHDDAEALACYRKAAERGLDDPELHLNVGTTLLDLGQFAEARASLLRSLKELPPKSDLRLTVQEQLQKCDRLLEDEKKLQVFLTSGTKPDEPYDLLTLANLCRTYKKYYRLAAEFYGEVLDDPFIRRSPSLNTIQLDAGRSAVLAAAGRGLDPKPPSSKEQSELRAQALSLLQSALAREKVNLSGRLESRLEVREQLSLWRTDADLASIRDPASLASLPAAEQDSWRAFWSGVDHVLSRTPALVSETAWRGTLTDRTLERRVDLKLLAGQACEIRLFSTAFRPEIQLTDSKGKPLGKSAPAAGTVSTLAFAAPGTETIRTMATSQQQRGTGAYVLTVRVFADKAN